LSSYAIGLSENHVRVRKLVIRNYELPGINKPGELKPVKMCRHDQRAQSFSETCHKIESSWWTMTQKLNAMKNLM